MFMGQNGILDLLKVTILTIFQTIKQSINFHIHNQQQQDTNKPNRNKYFKIIKPKPQFPLQTNQHPLQTNQQPHKRTFSDLAKSHTRKMHQFTETNIKLETLYKKFIKSKFNNHQYHVNQKSIKQNHITKKDAHYIFKRKEQVPNQNTEKKVKQQQPIVIFRSEEQSERSVQVEKGDQRIQKLVQQKKNIQSRKTEQVLEIKQNDGNSSKAEPVHIASEDIQSQTTIRKQNDVDQINIKDDHLNDTIDIKDQSKYIEQEVKRNDRVDEPIEQEVQYSPQQILLQTQQEQQCNPFLEYPIKQLNLFDLIQQNVNSQSSNNHNTQLSYNVYNQSSNNPNIQLSYNTYGYTTQNMDQMDMNIYQPWSNISTSQSHQICNIHQPQSQFNIMNNQMTINTHNHNFYNYQQTNNQMQNNNKCQDNPFIYQKQEEDQLFKKSDINQSQYDKRNIETFMKLKNMKQKKKRIFD